MHRSPRARRIGFAVGIVLFVLLSIRFLFYLHRSDCTIIFSSCGFLRGYTGFYYSPDGLQKDVCDHAEWYHTYNLEPNFYYFEFGD